VINVHSTKKCFNAYPCAFCCGHSRDNEAYNKKVNIKKYDIILILHRLGLRFYFPEMKSKLVPRSQLHNILNFLFSLNSSMFPYQNFQTFQLSISNFHLDCLYIVLDSYPIH